MGATTTGGHGMSRSCPHDICDCGDYRRAHYDGGCHTCDGGGNAPWAHCSGFSYFRHDEAACARTHGVVV